MGENIINSEEKSLFQSQGYVIKKKFFTKAEVEKLYQVALEDAAIKNNSFDLNDQTGKKTKLALWFTPGDDIYGRLTKSKRMVKSVEMLLEGEAPICHYHSKLMQKEPKVGGAWEWHQDYGYWYKNGFLFPEQMVSVMVALTPANKENGCLQVIPQTHKLGRVEHGFAGEQVGADINIVNRVAEMYGITYVELEPGDTLFFHSNILHRSEANLSDRSRWSLISAYNRASNKPTDKNTSSFTPIEMDSDEFILTAESGPIKGADFLRKEEDVALK